MCTYSTPSSTTIDCPMDSAGYSSFRVSPSNGTHHPIDSTSRAYFSVFDMVSVTQAEGEKLDIMGSECALFFCIKSYSITVSGGSQNETVVGNWSTTALRRGGSGSHGAEYVFIDVPVAKLNVDNTTRYAVTHAAMMALRGFMERITSGTGHADLSSLDYTSDWVEAMWNATDNLPAWIVTFADSLTSDIRQTGKLSETSKAGRMYDGSAVKLAPFVRVQWEWMCYPWLMIVLSILFLSHTVVLSARDNVSAWKGGSLPMLFCQVDNNVLDQVGDGMDVPAGLEGCVGDLAVAMYRGEKGQWRFRRASSGEGESEKA